MKNLKVLSLKLFFFIVTFLRKTRQCICGPICLTLTKVNPKMILENLLSLANLPEAQTLCIHEITKVVVIGEHNHLVLAIF